MPSVGPQGQPNNGVSQNGQYMSNGQPFTSTLPGGTNSPTSMFPTGVNAVSSTGNNGVFEAGGYFGSSPPPDQYVNGTDYTQIQAAQNNANHPNTYNPFGSSTNQYNPITGQWTENSQLSGPGATLFGGANGLAGSAVGDMTGGLDTSSLTPWGTAPSYSGATAATGAADAYAYAKGNLDPQWNQQETQLKGSLAAQGLHPGDPAYEQQMKSFGTSKDTAYQQANLGSFQTGASEAATQTGAEAAAAQTSDAQRMQQIQQQLTASGWGANEIQQLLNNPAVTGMPGNGASAQTSNQGANITSAQQIQQQQQAQQMNNLAAGGSAAVMGLMAL
jgi:hypothetical protein